MAGNRTGLTDSDAAAFMAAVEPARRRAEAETLDALFRDVTGFAPAVWGGGILGYGRYDYRYASGRQGSSLATGFAPRKAALSLYIMPGYADFGPILDRLGPHRTGAACLYITRLDRVDRVALRELIAAGLEDLGRRWTVHPA